MMASPPDSSLDCKENSNNTYDNHQSQKLEEFLARLEEERLKIEAFKRELPICMQLLTNALEAYRQQIQSIKTTANNPVFEEYIPLKDGKCEGSTEKATNNMNTPDNNKENWMTSAQLWVQTDQENENNQQQTISTKPSSPKQEIKLRSNNFGGAFVPFCKGRKEMENTKIIASVPHAEEGNNNSTPTNSNTQTQRKARRCWSPDLHRRFVNALQMLGGSQVATPKQIRELMKVDGLTNDEVKSHLQKYRLHTRRPISPNTQGVATSTPPQLVVLGGIWVQPEYSTTTTTPLYGGGATPHHATPHFSATSSQMLSSQDFYSSPYMTSKPLANYPSVHHMMDMFRPMPNQANGSHERGGLGHAGRSESIEDGKSESGSWKADSGGENGGEMKVLVLREEGEESNRGYFNLKF